MKAKILLLALLPLAQTLSVRAQSPVQTSLATDAGTTIKDRNLFNHLDLSVTGGSTGVGFDLGMPMSDYARLRIGGTFMPRFHYGMSFTAQLQNEGKEDGVSRFEKMASLLEGFVGQPIDNKVEMTATPNMNQLKVMVDVFPFKRKNWHFTAGFLFGSSRIAECINDSKEVTSLFAINLYNRMLENQGYLTGGMSIPDEILNKMKTYGHAGFPTGQYVKDTYYSEDVPKIDASGNTYIWTQDDFDYAVEEHGLATDANGNPIPGQSFDENGRPLIVGQPELAHAKGEVRFKKGDTYLMGASSENTAFAHAFVDRFRPYFGIGYESHLDKYKQWSIGCHAGVMLWGGAPKLVDHNGVDLMYDVENIRGQVGDYVNFARHAKAFPVLELKITRRLF